MTQSLELWHAGPAGMATFGELTSWASSRELAEQYMAMRGFGGPVIYTTEAQVLDDELLDLRQDPWATVADRFGLDRDDYEAEPDHDLFRALAPVFIAHGYRWVLFCEHPDGDARWNEWLYLGPEPLRATVATESSSDSAIPAEVRISRE